MPHAFLSHFITPCHLHHYPISIYSEPSLVANSYKNNHNHTTTDLVHLLLVSTSPPWALVIQRLPQASTACFGLGVLRIEQTDRHTLSRLSSITADNQGVIFRLQPPQLSFRITTVPSESTTKDLVVHTQGLYSTPHIILRTNTIHRLPISIKYYSQITHIHPISRQHSHLTSPDP